MEIVYLILIFLAPGLFISFCIDSLKFFEQKHNEKGTVYEQLTGAAKDSIIISAAAIIIYYIYCWYKNQRIICDFEDLFDKLSNFKFLYKYIILIVAISVIYIVIKEKIVNKLAYKYRKRQAEKNNLEPMGENQETVWWSTISNKEIIESIPRKNTIVAVYNHSTFVTAGALYAISSPADEECEILLKRTKEIERIIKEDENVDYPDRTGYPIMEYYNCNTGLRVRFFKPNRFIKKIEENQKKDEHRDKNN